MQFDCIFLVFASTKPGGVGYNGRSKHCAEAYYEN